MRLLTFLLGLALAACGTSNANDGCRDDSQCEGLLICVEGACICRTDDMCGDGNYCNPFGTCQVRPACLSNIDCNDGEICNSADPTGGKCISVDTCGSSVHCDFNHFCKPGTPSVCTPGCRSTGDCQLGYICAGGVCKANGTADNCKLCPANPTPDAAYCDYGEICSAEGQCVTHPHDAKLCESCTPTTGCGAGMVCLVDDAVAGGNYCAPGCARDSDCPSGYPGCGSLLLVFEECTGTGTCANGGRCLGGGEQQRGFCECVNQTDCNALCVGGICLNNFQGCTTDAECEPCQNGTCLATPLPCSTHTDCEVLCVQVPSGETTYGNCRTRGKVCGKDEGVTCDELTTGVSECRSVSGPG